MAGRTLDLMGLLSIDRLAAHIANTWTTWDTARAVKKSEWMEVRNFVFATDTSTTSNSELPWKNKTVTPKLTQIRDNLFANYLATIFPKRRWMKWEGSRQDDETKDKKKLIEDYMYWLTTHPKFKAEIGKALLDYIDYGNSFGMPEWLDERLETETGEKVGFVGPMFKRIPPEDIVFNPISASFEDSPKIIRSIVSLGELKKISNSVSSNVEDVQMMKEAYDYLLNLRGTVRSWAGDVSEKNVPFSMDGFQDYQTYLSSNHVELLTFYGDYYDEDKNEIFENYKIIVADRHKVIYKEQDQSAFGKPQIYHVGWRPRQNNLWAMGPLDNLVGLQYRIDHVENLKADCFDLITFPPIKVKGYVQDFEWGPFEKIYTGEDGDVELMSPDVNVLNNNIEIQALMDKMEELAGAPKEAMGFRTPGEKTKYEVQRLENAASRIFQNKAAQFEEFFLERVLNGMLELARRYGDSTIIRSIDPEFGATLFTTISKADLSGIGAVKPVGARHFSETAQLVQDMSSFFQSAVGMDEDVKLHFSSIGLAKMMEELLEIEDYNLVQENIRISERADAQSQIQQVQEDLYVQSQVDPGVTPAGTNGQQSIPKVG